MKIGSAYFTQSIVVNNTPVAMTGTATITWLTSTSGIVHVTDQSGTHDLSFSISGNYLTTYSGIVQTSTPGLTFEEWDVWLKVSDSLEILEEPEKLEKNENQKMTNFPMWIGEVLNR